MNRLAVAAALAPALLACGDYSTEDLRFLAAVPTREDLVVEVPAQAPPGASALVACTLGSADTWLWAKPTSDRLNASAEQLAGLVDLVRRYPPSWREKDARGWGPFQDRQHPELEVRVIIVREFPPELAGAPRHLYAFALRPRGSTAADWTNVLFGTFTGASASLGSGALVLDEDARWALGIAEPDAPHGRIVVTYDRASEPRRVTLALDEDGLGLPRFGYAFSGYADRSGRFDYALRNAARDTLVVSAGFDALGRGRADVGFTGAGGATGGFRQCWDATACLVWMDDPLNLNASCSGAPCVLGAEASCPAVP